jgi:bacteriocin-like protein
LLVIREGSYAMEEILRELTDTELDAVSGGSVAVGASSSVDTGAAVAVTGASNTIIGAGATFQLSLLNLDGPAAAVGVRAP